MSSPYSFDVMSVIDQFVPQLLLEMSADSLAAADPIDHVPGQMETVQVI